MERYLAAAETAAREAGKIQLKWRTQFTSSEKSPRNLVSQADLEAEQAIKSSLLGEFPGHSFLGEETGLDGDPENQFTWIVDPLDGTTNYVHQLPSYSVSIALQRNHELIVGVVFDPWLDECFVATRGGGATLNRQPIHVSQNRRLGDALVAVSLPADVGPASKEVDPFLQIMFACQGFRRLGSAALNLCYVAMGRLDAYWAVSLNSWDVAAGSLILCEAGGVVRHVEDREFELADPRIVAAANEELAEQLFSVVNKSA